MTCTASFCDIAVCHRLFMEAASTALVKDGFSYFVRVTYDICTFHECSP